MERTQGYDRAVGGCGVTRNLLDGDDRGEMDSNRNAGGRLGGERQQLWGSGDYKTVGCRRRLAFGVGGDKAIGSRAWHRKRIERRRTVDHRSRQCSRDRGKASRRTHGNRRVISGLQVSVHVFQGGHYGIEGADAPAIRLRGKYQLGRRWGNYKVVGSGHGCAVRCIDRGKGVGSGRRDY